MIPLLKSDSDTEAGHSILVTDYILFEPESLQLYVRNMLPDGNPANKHF